MNEAATGSGRTYFHKLVGDKRKSVSEQSYKHELGLGDLYVALRKTGLPLEWVHTSNQKDGFRFDRALTIFGKQFFIERERGTQTVSHAEEKVRQYLTKQGVFYVIFTVEDYQRNPFDIKTVKTAKDFGNEILDFLKTVRRRAQFTVAPHKKLVADPLGEFLVSPEPARYSFETIE